MKLSETYSCEDLQASVYLAPNQIRTCCKRFFFKGELKGDVVLLDVKDNVQPTLKVILGAKQELVRQINAGIANPCTGCPWLRKDNWGPLEKLAIKHLSFEYHSVCNMRCTYCSDTYYGGMKPSYSVRELYDSMKNGRALEECASVVWGGGEPTLAPDFAELFHEVTASIAPVRHKIFSNATRYLDFLSQALAAGTVTLVTSVDAGSDEIFKKIRGLSARRAVLDNLQRYLSEGASGITIKYILTEDGNAALSEVLEFVAAAKEFRLLSADFQISGNFKDERISADLFRGAITLLDSLRAAGASSAHFDDHLSPRISGFAAQYPDIITHEFSEKIASPKYYPQVVIWGAGQYAHRMLESCSFFKSVEVKYFIDEKIEKQGKFFHGKSVLSPLAIVDDELPIVIAVSSGFGDVLKSLHGLRVNLRRVVTKILL